jgi:hypothetical protein
MAYRLSYQIRIYHVPVHFINTIARSLLIAIDPLREKTFGMGAELGTEDPPEILQLTRAKGLMLILNTPKGVSRTAADYLATLFCVISRF